MKRKTMDIDTDRRMDSSRAVGRMIGALHIGLQEIGGKDETLQAFLLSDGFTQAEIDRYLGYALVILKELGTAGVMVAPPIPVVQLQPDEDCPGLWIGFATDADREHALDLFACAHSAGESPK